MGCAARYFEHATAECPLFLLYYPSISKDLGEQFCVGFGSPEHQAAVFLRVKKCPPPLWHKKGFKIKMSRWFSFFDKAEEMLPWWHSVALVLTSFCKDQGVIDSILKRPIYDQRAVFDTDEPDDIAVAPGKTDTTAAITCASSSHSTAPEASTAPPMGHEAGP